MRKVKTCLLSYNLMIYNAEVSEFYVPDILAENHCARN